MSAERPLVYVGVTGGIADVEPVGDVDVVHIDYDILDGDAPAADDLRDWLVDSAA